MADREQRLLEGCTCFGFHTHSHGICNTCKKPVIDWIDAHETAVEDFQREKWRMELIEAADEAISAQKRIIAHDGELEAHAISLRGLEETKANLFRKDWLDHVDDKMPNVELTGVPPTDATKEQ